MLAVSPTDDSWLSISHRDWLYRKAKIVNSWNTHSVGSQDRKLWFFLLSVTRLHDDIHTTYRHNIKVTK